MVFHPGAAPYFVCVSTSSHGSIDDSSIERMLELAAKQDAYLGNDHASQSGESIIFISYWKTDAAMRNWKRILESGEWKTRTRTKEPISASHYHIHLLESKTDPSPTTPEPMVRKISPNRSKQQQHNHYMSPIMDIPPVYDPTVAFKSGITSATPSDGAQLCSFEDFAQSLETNAAKELHNLALIQKAAQNFKGSTTKPIADESSSSHIVSSPYVPLVKNLFAGNIKDDDCSDLKSAPDAAAESSTGIFQYVTVDSPPTKRTTHKKTKRLRDGDDPFRELDHDEKLHYRVAILMAMHSRRANRTEFTSPPPENKVIMVGFLWEHFPECEQILEDCASEYFSACYQKLSTGEMRRLNDSIVNRIQAAIVRNHYEVHPDFDDRKLRERIRCYYKTLIANAKKRLNTLGKHRENDENRAYIKIFIRCAMDPNLSLRRSVEMATLNEEFKRRRMSKIEQLRRQVIEDQEKK